MRDSGADEELRQLETAEHVVNQSEVFNKEHFDLILMYEAMNVPRWLMRLIPFSWTYGRARRRYLHYLRCVLVSKQHARKLLGNAKRKRDREAKRQCEAEGSD